MASSTMHWPLSSNRSQETEPAEGAVEVGFFPPAEDPIELMGLVDTEIMSPATISLLRITCHFLLRYTQT